MNFRCFLPAWITAWVVTIYLPSGVIALLDLAPDASSFSGDLPARIWKIADDVGPVVKLMTGALLLAGFIFLSKWGAPLRRARHLVSVGIGLIAVFATVALIPAGLTRGFGAALTGERFEPTLTAIYLLGGALAGLTFMVVLNRCASRKQGTAEA